MEDYQFIWQIIEGLPEQALDKNIDLAQLIIELYDSSPKEYSSLDFFMKAHNILCFEGDESSCSILKDNNNAMFISNVSSYYYGKSTRNINETYNSPPSSREHLTTLGMQWSMLIMKNQDDFGEKAIANFNKWAKNTVGYTVHENKEPYITGYKIILGQKEPIYDFRSVYSYKYTVVKREGIYRPSPKTIDELYDEFILDFF